MAKNTKSKGKSKSEYFTIEYRVFVLRPQSIYITESKFYGDVLPKGMASHVQQVLEPIGTLYCLPDAASPAQIEQKIGGSDEEVRDLVSHAQRIVRRSEQIQRKEESELIWQEFWDGDVYLPMVEDDRLAKVSTKQFTTNWVRTSSRLRNDFVPKSKTLDCPVPDVAIGLYAEPADPRASAPQPDEPFTTFWEKHETLNTSALECLEEHSVAQLHPRPRVPGFLVYPGYIHEVKILMESIDAAANQLVKTLAFALDQQEELRLLAGAPEAERMPVFGAASAGPKIELWCAAYVGSNMQIVNLDRFFRLSRLSYACAFIAFTNSLRSWFLSTYVSKINAWLDLVWLNVKTGSAATVSGDVPMSGEPT